MKKSSFLFVLLLAATNIFAQGEFIIELDPTTGTYQKVGPPIPGIHWVYPEVRAYDEVNGRMIFPGGDPLPDHLYSVDVANSNVISSPFVPVTGNQTFSAPQYDNTTGILYGMYHDATTSSFYLASMDLVTGVYTPIGTGIAGLSGLSQGMDTYDEMNHKYICCSSGMIYTIDAQTGNAVSAPLGYQPGDGLISFSFNNANDTLYGLLYQNSTQQFHLAWVDRATGAVTTIGSGTNLANGNGSATIDVANRHFIYSYSALGGYYVSVMGLDNGNVLFNNQIILDNQDNVFSLKYDNVRNKLFAIHWDANITWPLAIDLVSFDARVKNGSTAAISWKALDVAGDEQFGVEHSTDGKIFSTIATLMASKGKEDYSTDHPLSEGNNYYRLRTTEINGRSTYSKVVRLSLSASVTDIALLPNIVSDNATLNIKATGNDNADILITDAVGKQVYKTSVQLQKGANATRLDLSALAAGSYTLHVQLNNDAAIPLRFVKL